MAYGLKYYSQFKNNILDVFRVEIYEKDFTGNAQRIILTGESFRLKYQSGDDKPITPIRASECEASLYSEDNFSLRDFYSEDDEKYRVDFILKSIYDRDGLTEFYTGNANVSVTGTQANIANQASTHGVQSGMLFEFLGQQYLIENVVYFAGAQNLRLELETAPPLGTYIATDFTILEYISTNVNLLKWRGFLVQDNCRQQFQDPPFAIKINATDNIALLKDVSFDAAAEGKYATKKEALLTVVGNLAVINNFPVNPFHSGDTINIDGTDYTILSLIYNPETNVLNMVLDGSPGDDDYIIEYESYLLLDKLRIIDYLRICIQATGIVLPVRVFANIFDSSHNQTDTDNPYSQTRIFSGKYISEEGVWEDCYTILEDMVSRFNAVIEQANGYWNIYRPQELITYANEIPGVQFDESFENPNAITWSGQFTIQHRTDIEFLNADAETSINRPYKFSRETFDYVQPKQIIKGADLQSLGAFLGSSTAVVDGVNYRYDRYDIPEFWQHENSMPNSSEYDTSYIVVVTNTDEDVETERYIYMPHGAYNFKSLEFEPVDVTVGDTVSLSLQYKNITSDGSDNTRFRVRMLLITAAGASWNLRLFDPGGGNPKYLNWANVTSSPVTTDTLWRTGIGISLDAAQNVDQYNSYDLENFTQDLSRVKIPPLPADGMLRIGIQGFSDTNTNLPDVDAAIKDIRITFTYNIAENVVIGHTHTHEQAGTIKNVEELDIMIDDSPRNQIAGTLFNNVQTNFLTGIGYVYFTKTRDWNRRDVTETRKLGDIITQERKQVSMIARTPVEGTVFGCRNGSDLITPMHVAKIYTLQNLNFIFGVCEFDFYRNTFNASLWELYATGENDADADYEFKYLYETT